MNPGLSEAFSADLAPVIRGSGVARKHRQVKPDAKKRRRKKRPVETRDFNDALHRMVRALGRRVGQGDPDELVMLARLRDEVDAATRSAVSQLRENTGASWARIGHSLGITKQSAQERFGRDEARQRR